MHFQQIQKELPQDEREITLEQHNFFLDFVMRYYKYLMNILLLNYQLFHLVTNSCTCYTLVNSVSDVKHSIFSTTEEHS